MAFDLYAVVTEQIIGMLDKGVVPWRSPILRRPGSGGLPQNLESTQPYRGVNLFLLGFTAWTRGFDSQYWLTFRQAKAHGGSIRKGEKASMVVFWKQLETANIETGEAKTVPLLRYYNVFNVNQCEGIKSVKVEEAPPAREFTPIEAADSIAKGYQDGPTVEHAGQEACYRPLLDSVRMPEPTRFNSAEEYYATLFHELAHSTGHSKRLDRKLDSQIRPYGSPDYGREELIAEMAAAFLCGHAGIKPAVIENQAAYLQGWLKMLKEDKRLVVNAAGAAQKAADWIRGLREAA